MILVIAIGAFVSTMLGGLFALKFQDKLHLILGFSAGSVIGVAFFDLLPEALATADPYPASTITSTIAVGFLIYLVLDRFVFVHARGEGPPGGSRRGHLGAATLTIHSCMDGIAVGLAFQINTQIGVVVAVAVLLHDFSDGINTVNVVTGHGMSRRHAAWWLIMDGPPPRWLESYPLSSFRFRRRNSAALWVCSAVFSSTSALPISYRRASTPIPRGLPLLQRSWALASCTSSSNGLPEFGDGGIFEL
jgi:hypothetical protein